MGLLLKLRKLYFSLFRNKFKYLEQPNSQYCIVLGNTIESEKHYFIAKSKYNTVKTELLFEDVAEVSKVFKCPIYLSVKRLKWILAPILITTSNISVSSNYLGGAKLRLRISRNRKTLYKSITPVDGEVSIAFEKLLEIKSEFIHANPKS